METLSLTARRLRRLGIVMAPDPADMREAEGVLNSPVYGASGPHGTPEYGMPTIVAQ